MPAPRECVSKALNSILQPHLLLARWLCVLGAGLVASAPS
jgi:hypothetical protein